MAQFIFISTIDLSTGSFRMNDKSKWCAQVSIFINVAFSGVFWVQILWHIYPMDHPEPLPSPWGIHIYEQSPSKFFEARLGRRYLTIPSADQCIGGQPLKIIVTNVCLIQKPSENYRFQWLPPTIPFNSDGTPENNWNFNGSKYWL